MIVALLLALAPASAQDTGDTAAPPPIVSGTQVGADRYDDAVAVLSGGVYRCTGTLVGPKTVVTTALCAPDASHVIIGSKDWASNQGELLPIASYQMHPLYFNEGLDIAVLRLTRSSQFEPRAIADGCAIESIAVDAPLTFAGFGALRVDEVDPNTRLNAVSGVITSLACDESDGCDEDAPQGTEFLAGGEGVGPCTGDEGSPAYLSTTSGDVLLGIASRTAASATQECGDSFIYTRADAYKNWIEEAAQDELAFPICEGTPIVTIQPFDPIPSGGGGRTSYTVTDSDHPDGPFTYLFPEQPEHGFVDILTGSQLRYRADRDYTGPDSFTLKVQDPDGNESVVGVDVDVVRKGFLGCGCNNGPHSASWYWLIVAGTGLLAGRRRRVNTV